MKTYLFGHIDEQTALEVKNYPWGFRLKTSIFYWIETDTKRGDRFCSYTIDPKNGRKCAPKKGTYSSIAAMYRDESNGHIHHSSITIYSNPEEREAFMVAIGGESKLNPHQIKQLKQLRGEKIVVLDEFMGTPKKDFKVKFEKARADATCYSEVRITFDRPDGVSVKEIFEALKSIEQTKLQKVWDGYETKFYGHTPGFARICVRGGVQLTTVNEDSYKEWLALDVNTVKEESHV